MSLPITRGSGARPSLGSDARSEGRPRLWASPGGTVLGRRVSARPARRQGPCSVRCVFPTSSPRCREQPRGARAWPVLEPSPTS